MTQTEANNRALQPTIPLENKTSAYYLLENDIKGVANL
jgi:hypothetical protein